MSLLPNFAFGYENVTDLANGNDYTMAAKLTDPDRGPTQLERTDLTTGATYIGPTFSVSDLAVTGDDVWVSGPVGSVYRPPSQVVACEVDPVTMQVVRSLTLPVPSVEIARVEICAGPGGSVWIGYAQSLLRVEAATGTILARATVPAGWSISDFAVDPSGRFLYVSSSDALAEYDATTGRLLTSTTSGPITYSVAGANLVAVPDGVWASFNTGMMGLTVLFRHSDLAAIVPPGLGPPITYPVSTLFNWVMDADVAYGDDTLFLSQDPAGLVACLDPNTGAVRAEEQLPPPADNDNSINLVAVSSAAHVVYGTVLAGAGGSAGEELVRLTPPAACWP